MIRRSHDPYLHTVTKKIRTNSKVPKGFYTRFLRYPMVNSESSRIARTQVLAILHSTEKNSQITAALWGSLFLQLIIQSGSELVKVQPINQPRRSQKNYFGSGKTLVILHLIPTLKRNTLIGRDLKHSYLVVGLQTKLTFQRFYLMYEIHLLLLCSVSTNKCVIV